MKKAARKIEKPAIKKPTSDFPKTIKFLSDDSVVTFVNLLNGTQPIAEYKFTKVDKRSPNKGKSFPLTMEQIEKLKGYKLIEIK